MSLTDAQVSRLTAALDKQLEADRQFAAKTKGIFNQVPAPPLPPKDVQEALATDRADAASAPPILTSKPFEEDTPAETELAEPPPPSARMQDTDEALAPMPLEPPEPASAVPVQLPVPVPQSYEDRYAQGWRDASEYLKPQLSEAQRRYILTGTRLTAARRWVRWLPIICFFCTLFGFALGWGWSTLEACGSWQTVQKWGVFPKSLRGHGSTVVP